MKQGAKKNHNKICTTFVKETVGKEMPIEKPTTTPITIVIIHLTVSFGFRSRPLQREMCAY